MANPTATFETSLGTFTAEIFQDQMPVTAGNFIKLAKDASGQHHYIPLTWVTSVDDKIHVDRPGAQAMREWTTAPPPKA